MNGVAYDASIVEGIFHKQIFGAAKNVDLISVSDKPRLVVCMKKPFKGPSQHGTSCSEVQLKHIQDCAGEIRVTNLSYDNVPSAGLSDE